jgi:hypothetical protein
MIHGWHLVRVAKSRGRPSWRVGRWDGNRQPVDAETNQLSVVMSDGQQHRYLRTGEFWIDEDDRNRAVFTWEGRYFGPK